MKINIDPFPVIAGISYRFSKHQISVMTYDPVHYRRAWIAEYVPSHPSLIEISFGGLLWKKCRQGSSLSNCGLKFWNEKES
jgi:hypothetical protein